ncbi:Alpha and gamma-adaptin-binding protein p34 [Taenia crassiceps]|uniref:Alpha and gamma-adaptin-binding protein p34 n=1 Tax=Taenia crassiceps TaxID=6207 RepID=A0ABR4QF52_9CEST
MACVPKSVWPEWPSSACYGSFSQNKEMPPQVNIINAHADDITNLVYGASVQLKLIPYSSSKTDVKDAEALIICFDTGNLGSWSVACDWLKLGEEEDIPVQLLVCGSLSSENLRTEVFKEATKNHFEVVQLSPHSDEIEEDEEYGVARITAALVAHKWSNLVLKNTKTPVSTSAPTKHSQQKSSVVNPVEKKANQKDKSDGDEDDEDSDGKVFNELFPKLMEMRSRGASMDLEGRRKMAEKPSLLCQSNEVILDTLCMFEGHLMSSLFVSMEKRSTSSSTLVENKEISHMTVQFWRALELDEEEIRGLSDDGED